MQLEVVGEIAQQRGLGLGAEYLLDDFTAREDVHHRNGHDLVLLRGGRVLVDVELDDIDLVGVLRGDLGEHRGHHAAQYSTITGLEFFRTSASKLASVTALISLMLIVPSRSRWSRPGAAPRSRRRHRARTPGPGGAACTGARRGPWPVVRSPRAWPGRHGRSRRCIAPRRAPAAPRSHPA